MPIISMNLMETLLQNEYTKCNESIPYKTFDHYTARDFKAFFGRLLSYEWTSLKRAILSKKLLMGSNTQRVFMPAGICCGETFSKLHRKENYSQIPLGGVLFADILDKSWNDEFIIPSFIHSINSLRLLDTCVMCSTNYSNLSQS